MDVQKKLDDIVEAIGSARSLPMSASCVVNRADLLAGLEEVRRALPGSLAQARELIGDREHLVAQARREAQRIIESAHAERGTLVSDTLVARQSQDEADRILARARQEADEIRAEADEYVDSKLANFEVVLSKTIGSVDRGREKLLGWRPGADAATLAGASADDGSNRTAGSDGVNGMVTVAGHPDPHRPADADDQHVAPALLVQQVDAYVDAKLSAFEAVLTKTLEAVGRGRRKLHGPAVDGALGDHMAAQDAAGVSLHNGDTSDADYLAGLAELTDDEPGLSRRVRRPRTAPEATDPAPAVTAPVPSQPEWPPYAPAGTLAGYQPQIHHDPPAPAGPHTHQDRPDRPASQPGALDETSLFDTGMIDLDRLRPYDEGR
ncbi:cell division initiation protein [Streptomyces sp. NPDC005963]|uniref:cell division initiation protein n=1 Tax=Streptomyces sp. NPDC005963 TaxID=3156721 RepID=UPI0033C54012